MSNQQKEVMELYYCYCCGLTFGWEYDDKPECPKCGIDYDEGHISLSDYTAIKRDF